MSAIVLTEHFENAKKFFMGKCVRRLGIYSQQLHSTKSKMQCDNGVGGRHFGLPIILFILFLETLDLTDAHLRCVL